jgi:hypothetical protein
MAQKGRGACQERDQHECGQPHESLPVHYVSCPETLVCYMRRKNVAPWLMDRKKKIYEDLR